MIAEEAFQLKHAVEVAGAELGAQRMAEGVGGGGVDLVVVAGGVDGGEHGEQRFIAVELVLGVVAGRARRMGGLALRLGLILSLRQGRQRSGAARPGTDMKCGAKPLSI